MRLRLLSGVSLLCLLIIGSTFCWAASEPFTITTIDGVELGADLSPAPFVGTQPTILLLPMLGHLKKDYQSLVQALNDRGLTVVSVDLRGHGQSTKRLDGSSLDFHQFTNQDWAKLTQDVETILLNSRTKPPLSYLGIVGASIGANAAAMAASKNKQVKAVVLLSPGLNYRGLEPSASLRAFGRPAYIIAGQADEYSAESASNLAQLAHATSRFELLDSSNHGTDLLKNNPTLVAKIADWLKERLGE